ncbi:competence/damage-inducible protein A [Flavisolibacter tropicus]|uniref:CinA-like protein n=1 Tax=Flavisolibacter tropicus TaxID=1492898 RepID=A0A172TS44_9BACT|nr:competence/damage-inducible protein A [Flavisolibacter tropicus]ANE49905.1 damage-inducible protein CinA [Flavisolibacter tropicus]
MRSINASIITIGDELLIGQTIDTNSAFIGQSLNKIGIWLKRRVAVGDVKDEILNALQEQSKNNDIIIITGGLGPTADDITKPALCEYFNSSLIVDENVLQHVTNIFARFNRPMIERNAKQAEVPDNCLVLHNERGTAPGMWFEKDDVIYISLPGVPHEMKGLIEHQVIPRLLQKLELPAVSHRTLLTAGQGESVIADKLTTFEAALPSHIKLAYLPAYGMVRLRLTGRTNDASTLEIELGEYFDQLKGLVNEWMVADKDISIAEAIIQLFKTKGKTLATAESCTGGYIAHLITSIAGSSAIYNGSIVSYANSAKENLLGVEPSTLQEFGAVSEETVQQMAQGVLKAMSTDYAIATSGIMGPDGGSPEKPVGTVWIAVANKERTKAIKLHFRFDRQRNIELTAHTALNLLRLFILEEEKE